MGADAEIEESGWRSFIAVREILKDKDRWHPTKDDRELLEVKLYINEDQDADAAVGFMAMLGPERVIQEGEAFETVWTVALGKKEIEEMLEELGGRNL